MSRLSVLLSGGQEALLSGGQQAEAEPLLTRMADEQQFNVALLCHDIDDNDVYPFSMACVSDPSVANWFATDKCREAWEGFFRATDDRIYWRRATVWLCEEFPASHSESWCDIVGQTFVWYEEDMWVGQISGN